MTTTPDDVVGLIRQVARQESGGDTVALGTVATVDGTSATVTFDGETAAGARSYPAVNYSPVVGDRVALLRAGSGWIILGKVGSAGGPGGGGDHADADHADAFAALGHGHPDLGTTKVSGDLIVANADGTRGLLASAGTDHRVFFAPRNTADDGWEWPNEFGFDPVTRRWTFDQPIEVDGQVLGDTGWIDLPLATGMAQQSSSWTPRYRRANGVVFMAGLVTTPGTGIQLVGTLPSGFRPSWTEMFVVRSTASPYHTRMDVQSSGNVILNPSLGTGWHALTCSFVADN